MNIPSILLESSTGYQAVSLESQLLRNREVFLTEEVSSETVAALIKQMLLLEQESHEPIYFYISSLGGDVTAGLALYDVITMMESEVYTVAMGMVASMGTILYLAGTRRYILPSSQLMIHDPSYGNGNFSYCKPAELQQKVDKLKETGGKLSKIIAEKTGRPLKEVQRLCKTDSYFNSEESLKFGLATEILAKLPEGSITV
ncbi:MAG: ATP-dependent Clp protease proteolytic subunit [Lachnospiraceae bacterium]|nr:ATP-dependent Clp protease proteolytic subunit [Lachnospiraceae bacterium]